MATPSRSEALNSGGGGSRDAVKFECPSCKAAMHITVSRLRPGSKVQCTACEDEHTLAAADIPKLLAEHRKRLEKLKQKK